jgi:hypothetical protein
MAAVLKKPWKSGLKESLFLSLPGGYKQNSHIR